MSHQIDEEELLEDDQHSRKCAKSVSSTSMEK